MSDLNLIPKCPDCAKPMNRDDPSCQCIELRLPGMELHRAQPLARRLLYLEGQVELLIAREMERGETPIGEQAPPPVKKRSKSNTIGNKSGRNR